MCFWCSFKYTHANLNFGYVALFGIYRLVTKVGMIKEQRGAWCG
jgi:hypothetical protein